MTRLHLTLNSKWILMIGATAMNHMEVSMWSEGKRGKETLFKAQLFKARECSLLLSATDRRMLKETNKHIKIRVQFYYFY